MDHLPESREMDKEAVCLTTTTITPPTPTLFPSYIAGIQHQMVQFGVNLLLSPLRTPRMCAFFMGGAEELNVFPMFSRTCTVTALVLNKQKMLLVIV